MKPEFTPHDNLALDIIACVVTAKLKPDFQIVHQFLNILISVSDELRKAVDDGYEHVFYFQDGNVLSETLPELMHTIAQVYKQPCPCLALQGNIYRIVLPSGMKGFAIVPWKQDNDE